MWHWRDFRDACTSLASKSVAATATFHKIGNGSMENRQLCNEALPFFLKALRFPTENNLHELFSCSNCENRDGEGNKYFDGVVMDCTVLGIFCALPEFNKHITLVSTVPRMPDKQFIIREPKTRAFIDTGMVSAKLMDGACNCFVASKLH